MELLDIKQQAASLIREARKAKGLTQDELAELLGIDKMRVSRHEGGKTNPTVETLQKIFSVLDVSVTLTIKKE